MAHPCDASCNKQTLREKVSLADAQALLDREIELWKKEEIEKHRVEMKATEAQRMQFLEDEWRRHEQERQKEIISLKSKLHDQTQKAMWNKPPILFVDPQCVVRCALKDTEEHERKVIALQESLIRRKKDLERQHVARLEETDAAINRLQEDFERQFVLEREKAKEAVEKVTQLRQQLKSSEQQMEKKEKEILHLKKTNVPSQVVVLEQELASFKKMHETAQERIVALEEEKNKFASLLQVVEFQVVDIRFKVRVVQLAQQLGALQAMQAADAKCKEPSGKKADLNAKSCQGAKGSQFPAPSPEEFVTLKKEVEALKIRSADREMRPVQIMPKEEAIGTQAPAHDMRVAVIPDSETAEDEIKRMVQNRTDLLNTGVYHEGDELILELDERICQLTQQMSDKARS